MQGAAGMLGSSDLVKILFFPWILWCFNKDQESLDFIFFCFVWGVVSKLLPTWDPWTSWASWHEGKDLSCLVWCWNHADVYWINCYMYWILGPQRCQRWCRWTRETRPQGNNKFRVNPHLLNHILSISVITVCCEHQQKGIYTHRVPHN